MKRNFMTLIKAKWLEKKFLCVGLDTDYDKIPQTWKDKNPGTRAEQQLAYNKWIVDQTKDIVCAYKPNIAFYECYGAEGWVVLKATIAYINEVAPDVPVILDAKRADIGNTNFGYTVASFVELNADAITVQNYFGSEAMKPFLDMKDKGVIVLCRTSNKGAGEIQDLPVVVHTETMDMPKPLYQVIAKIICEKWNYNKNCFIVVGATYPEELGEVRKIIGEMGVLAPGMGTQGADVQKLLENGLNDAGDGLIINSSSAIIFAESPRDTALYSHSEITGSRERALELRVQSIH